MAKQTINIGSASNDGTGDLLRDAFDKVNDNFDEVYSTYTMSGKLTVGNGSANSIANSTAVQVSNSTVNAILAANGLTVGSTFVGNSSISTVNMTVSGNLTVLGTTTTINATSLDIADLNITVAKNAANSAAANGAGITIAGANATINYTNSSNTIVFSHPIQVGSYTVNGTNYTGTANNALYVNANNGITSNSTGVFVAGNTGLVVNATGVHINSSYVQNTDSRTLSGNLTFSGANNVFSANVTFNGYVIATDDVVITRPEGRIVFSGSDIPTSNNFMYLERTPTDIGGGYSVEISSSNNMNTYFRYGGTSGTLMIWTLDGSGSILVGNSTVNASINSTAFNGTANNASNLGGTAAASYVQNTDSRTLSGNLTFSGANTTVSSNTLNLGTSTVAANGYTYLPNGLKLNWGYVAANSTDGSVTFASAFGTAAFSITATSNDSSVSAAVTTINTSSATILTSSATTTNVYYMAIGY